MTRAQIWLIIWTIWTVTAPMGIIVDIILSWILHIANPIEYIDIVHDAAIEGAKDATNGIFSDATYEFLSLMAMIVFIITPFKAWGIVKKEIEIRIDACRKRRENEGS